MWLLAQLARARQPAAAASRRVKRLNRPLPPNPPMLPQVPDCEARQFTLRRPFLEPPACGVVNTWFHCHICRSDGLTGITQTIARLQGRRASTIGLAVLQECYGRVAEWFKAPVLKLGLRSALACRPVRKNQRFRGFPQYADSASCHLILPRIDPLGPSLGPNDEREAFRSAASAATPSCAGKPWIDGRGSGNGGKQRRQLWPRCWGFGSAGARYGTINTMALSS